MNFDEAASYLRISRSTLTRWIRQGLLADAGLYGSRIDPIALGNWAKRRGIEVGIVGVPKADLPPDLFAEAIERGVVSSIPEASDARGAIEAALGAFDYPREAQAQLLEAILERERLASTALGHGVAIPHPRQPCSPLVQAPLVGVIYVDPAVEWAAADGIPVHTMILILSPNTRIHLQLLSRIAFVLRTPGIDELLANRPPQAELVEHLRGINRDRHDPSTC